MFLAATAEWAPPMPEHSMPEFAEAVEVPRYRVIVEVALHNRLELLTSLEHGWIGLTLCCLYRRGGRNAMVSSITVMERYRSMPRWM